MLPLRHERGLAHYYDYADRLLFLAEERIHASGTPSAVVKHRRDERARSFLARDTRCAF